MYVHEYSLKGTHPTVNNNRVNNLQWNFIYIFVTNSLVWDRVRHTDKIFLWTLTVSLCAAQFFTNSQWSRSYLWEGHCVHGHHSRQLPAFRFSWQRRRLQRRRIILLLKSLIIGRVAVMVVFLVPQSPQSVDTHPRLPFGVVIHHIIQLTCVYLKITNCVIVSIVSLLSCLFYSQWPEPNVM